MVKELRHGLTRGYQLHVLGYSIHAVLCEMSPLCGAGAMDEAVIDLVAVFIDDIFGVTAEEKQQGKIVAKWKEARSTQSYHSFDLLSRVIAPESFYHLVEPIKDLMATTESASTTHKLEDILRNIATGLHANSAVDLPERLKFIFKYDLFLFCPTSLSLLLLALSYLAYFPTDPVLYWNRLVAEHLSLTKTPNLLAGSSKSKAPESIYILGKLLF